MGGSHTGDCSKSSRVKETQRFGHEEQNSFIHLMHYLYMLSVMSLKKSDGRDHWRSFFNGRFWGMIPDWQNQCRFQKPRLGETLTGISVEALWDQC